MTATPYTAQTSQLRNAIAWTAGVALVWILAAVMRSETTLHLGPVFMPLIPAFLLKGDERVVPGIVAGIALGASTITLLSLTGNLDGPPLEPFQSTLTESFVVLAVSGLLALVFARLTERS